MIRVGDCIEAMRGMDEASVDAVVTDPPYGLEFMGKEWDRLGAGVEVTAKSAGGFGKDSPTNENAYAAARVRFGASPVAMQAWHQAWATEVLRVLKPGGHLLAFGGTRTYHRLACAIEDAGFEIRDCLAWIYGSGFPKSLNVSKAIDKAAPRVGMFDAFASHFRERREASGLTQKQVAVHFPSKTGGLTGCVWNWENGANVPTPDQWETLAPMLGLSDEWLPLIRRIEAEREVLGKSDELLGRKSGIGNEVDGHYTVGGTKAEVYDVTAPATPAAAEWQGWGTALKPAHEPIVLARKPLTGTVSANVLQHGTGALNVDGTRVEAPGGVPSVPQGAMNPRREGLLHPDGRNGEMSQPSPLGRWPANVVMDETAGRLLDEQSGNSVSRCASMPLPRGHAFAGETYGGDGATGEDTVRGFSDTGGASRFFYCPKAGRGERNAGLDGFEAKPAGVHDDDAYVWPKNGDGSPRGKKVEPRANHHPTVKPIDLMRWLCRLVTPPGGTILDPFVGSGTTGCAAVLEGFDFIGCEREAEYVAIAEARIKFWRRYEGAETEAVLGSEDQERRNGGQLDLLGEAT